MKKPVLFIWLFCFLPILLFAQDYELRTFKDAADKSERFYFISGPEFIVSFANIDYLGSEDGSGLRFAPVFNFQSYFNYDASDYFGILAGFAIRNVGFIYDLPDSDLRKKYRTYNVGIPVGFKVGRMSKTFLYAGYEMEIPFHYKEKTFEDGKKTDKTSVWFSNRNQGLYSSLFLGIQLPYKANIKFKYYLTEFFNQDFSTVQDGQTIFPYRDFEAHVFYISVSFTPFRNTRLSIDEGIAL